MDISMLDELSAGYELAVFHSHPETEPRPSRTDIENIGLWEGRPYLSLRASGTSRARRP
jgi:proteasome lid subunit RPN8/RPN11